MNISFIITLNTQRTHTMPYRMRTLKHWQSYQQTLKKLHLTFNSQKPLLTPSLQWWMNIYKVVTPLLMWVISTSLYLYIYYLYTNKTLRGFTILLTFTGCQIFLFPWLHSNENTTLWLWKTPFLHESQSRRTWTWKGIFHIHISFIIIFNS